MGGTPRVNTWTAIIFNIYKWPCSFHFIYTCLCFNASTTENLIEDINAELKHVHDRITANKLCINAQKSSDLIVSPKRNNKNDYQNLLILYDNTKINIAKTEKYLGVYIDDDINFKTHIHFLHIKLSCILGIL